MSNGSDDLRSVWGGGPWRYRERSGEVQPFEQYSTLVGKFLDCEVKASEDETSREFCYSLMNFPSRFEDTAKCALPSCLAGHRAKERTAA